jgi:hypothetical protein
MSKEKIQYRVRKVTIIYKQCPICHGVGKREVKFSGIFKMIDCQHCKNGVAEIEHLTEISLKDAMNELGIHNLIRNTVNEILDSKVRTCPDPTLFPQKEASA